MCATSFASPLGSGKSFCTSAPPWDNSLACWCRESQFECIACDGGPVIPSVKEQVAGLCNQQRHQKTPAGAAKCPARCAPESRALVAPDKCVSLSPLSPLRAVSLSWMHSMLRVHRTAHRTRHLACQKQDVSTIKTTYALPLVSCNVPGRLPSRLLGIRMNSVLRKCLRCW